uniref:Uncharacterized protein n=1 Tax=Anopheles atroparvus TaxID=41427 RepID=A0A182IWQ5_ANOAO
MAPINPSSSFWSVRTLSDSSRNIRVSSSIRPCWAVSCRSMRCTFCSRSCTRPHTVSIETMPVDADDGSTDDDGLPVVGAVLPTMWIVLALRFWGVGERLVFRRCTLSGRLFGDGCRLLVTASDVPLFSADAEDEEMAILVVVVVVVVVLLVFALLDSADIDLVIALTFVEEDEETVCCCWRSVFGVEDDDTGSFRLADIGWWWSKEPPVALDVATWLPSVDGTLVVVADRSMSRARATLPEEGPTTCVVVELAWNDLEMLDSSCWWCWNSSIHGTLFFSHSRGFGAFASRASSPAGSGITSGLGLSGSDDIDSWLNRPELPLLSEGPPPLAVMDTLPEDAGSPIILLGDEGGRRLGAFARLARMSFSTEVPRSTCPSSTSIRSPTIDLSPLSAISDLGLLPPIPSRSSCCALPLTADLSTELPPFTFCFRPENRFPVTLVIEGDFLIGTCGFLPRTGGGVDFFSSRLSMLLRMSDALFSRLLRGGFSVTTDGGASAVLLSSDFRCAATLLYVGEPPATPMTLPPTLPPLLLVVAIDRTEADMVADDLPPSGGSSDTKLSGNTPTRPRSSPFHQPLSGSSFDRIVMMSPSTSFSSSSLVTPSTPGPGPPPESIAVTPRPPTLPLLRLDDFGDTDSIISTKLDGNTPTRPFSLPRHHPSSTYNVDDLEND